MDAPPELVGFAGVIYSTFDPDGLAWQWLASLQKLHEARTCRGARKSNWRLIQHPSTPHTLNMSASYQQGAPARAPQDDSDVEDEVLASEYKEQVQYGDDDELERVASSGPQDLQAQLAAAAQPLEYGATLETKIASYDSYCNLFHYILNSDGPVDLEVPNVCPRHAIAYS